MFQSSRPLTKDHESSTNEVSRREWFRGRGERKDSERGWEIEWTALANLKYTGGQERKGGALEDAQISAFRNWADGAAMCCDGDMR